jgi:hypothetical protein
MSLIEVDKLLTTPDCPVVQFWMEDEVLYPVITDTHMEWTPRQCYTWDEVAREEHQEYEPESTALGVFSANILPDERIAICEAGPGINTLPPIIRGTIPSTSDPEYPLGFLVEFIPRPDQEPVVLARTSPQKLSLWSVDGVLIGESSNTPDNSVICDLEPQSSHEYILWSSDTGYGLVKVGDLLNGHAELRRVNLIGNKIAWSRDPTGIIVLGNNKLYPWDELYNIKDFTAHVIEEFRAVYHTSFLAQFLEMLSSSESTNRVQIRYDHEGPGYDTDVNKGFQQYATLEPAHALVSCAEADLRVALHTVAHDTDLALTLRVWGSGSRIIMPIFQQSLLVSQFFVPDDAPLSLYVLLFGQPNARTPTDQLDLSLLFDDKYLLRCRLKNTLHVDQTATYDPESVLEVYIRMI